MSNVLDALDDKPRGHKFKDASGFVWKKVKDGWISLEDPDEEVWSDEDLAEHIEELNYEREMEVNFED